MRNEQDFKFYQKSNDRRTPKVGLKNIFCTDVIDAKNSTQATYHI